MDYRLDEYVHDENPPRRWLSPLVWTLLVVGGWLIYEATAQPALAVAAVCLKFGWNDFRTGLWLARRDPDRRRGPACLWLFLGVGLWKAGLTAGFLMFTLPMVIHWPAQGQQAKPPQGASFEAFMGAGLMVMASFSLASLAGTVAFLLAWRSALKLWAESRIHRARRQNLWPPTLVTLGRRNWADALLVTVILVFLAPVLIVVLIVLVNLMVQVGGGLEVTLFVVVPFLFGGPILVLLLRDKFGRRLIAKSPLECWDAPGGSEPESAAVVSRRLQPDTV